jgi:NAD(P)-dependent dehydrogenase (short-subunit alcohol dehydrogenase family)
MAFVVAVTGGARGIGRATAAAFAAAGATVVIGDVDADAAAATASEIGVRAETLDVRDPASWAAFVAAVGNFLDTPAEMRELQLDVNLRGVINGMSAVLPAMRARGRGHVVNVASLAGKIATPNAAIYTATKHAVVGLTESVRAELHGSGVRLTAVLPSFVTTEMTEGLPLKGIPMVDPKVVAGAILRQVRRGGPALVPVPRWMGGIPRLAAFTPQSVLDVMRHGFGDRDVSDSNTLRERYQERLRGLLRRPDEGEA